MVVRKVGDSRWNRPKNGALTRLDFGRGPRARTARPRPHGGAGDVTYFTRMGLYALRYTRYFYIAFRGLCLTPRRCRREPHNTRFLT